METITVQKPTPAAHKHEAQRLLAQTPVGPILLRCLPAGIIGLEFLARAYARAVSSRSGSPQAEIIADRAQRELAEYFAGRRRRFDAPICLDALTDFQRAVLQQTARIPFGEVAAYGDVASRIGKPNSARAVGGALARNPVAIIIPCHRVVAQDRRLHGFSSPRGITTKAWLLRHEGLHIKDHKVR